VTMVDTFDTPTLVLPAARLESTTMGYQAITNIGNAALVFPVPAFSTNAMASSPFSLNPDSTCPIIGIHGVESTLDAGDSCVYNVSFTPNYNEGFDGQLEVEFNNLNEPEGADGNLVFLHGVTSNWDPTRTTMRVSPNPVQVGLGVTMTVTVVDTNSALTIPEGAVTVTDTVGSQVTAHYDGGDDGFLASTAQASLVVQQ
jgi:hypothetical protein